MSARRFVVVLRRDSADMDVDNDLTIVQEHDAVVMGTYTTTERAEAHAARVRRLAETYEDPEGATGAENDLTVEVREVYGGDLSAREALDLLYGSIEAPAPRRARREAARPSALRRSPPARGLLMPSGTRTVFPVLEADGATGEADVAAMIRRVLRLSASLEHGAAVSLRDGSLRQPYLTTKTWRKNFGRPVTSGRASSGGTVHLAISEGCPREEVELLVLHEMAHFICPESVHHGPYFRRALRAMAREWWADRPSVRRVRPLRKTYAEDEAIWHAARADARYAAGLSVDQTAYWSRIPGERMLHT